MNFELLLPFVKLSFKNADQQHQDFFNSLFFTESKTKPKLEIEVSFVDSFKLPQQYFELEHKSIATDADFFTKDLLANKIKLNFDTFSKNNIRIEAENDVDLYYLFTIIVEPLIVIWATSQDVLYVHASSLEKEGKAYVFPAWRNTGKTNTVLSLGQEGFNFLADDFSVVYKGTVYPYSKTFNIFSYNFASFPGLLKNIGWARATRVTLVGFIRRVLTRLGHSISGTLGKAFLRISTLAEVATNIKVSPAILNVELGKKAKLQQVFLLQKTSFSSTKSQSITRKNIESKLLLTAKCEVQELTEIISHFKFFFPEKSLPKPIANFSKQYLKVITNEISQAKHILLSPSDAQEAIIKEL